MPTQLKPTQTLIPILLCLFSLTFIGASFAFGQGTSKFKSVDVRDEFLQVDIQMKAGILELSTNPAGEAEMEFDFTRDSWKPDVQMLSESGRGHLSIKQPKGSSNSFSMKDTDRNSSKVSLPQGVATNLDISIGAGETSLDLGGARLNRLEMKAGAGDFTINLANTSVSDLEISAGVGSLTLDLTGKRTTIYMPASMGG